MYAYTCAQRILLNNKVNKLTQLIVVHSQKQQKKLKDGETYCRYPPNQQGTNIDLPYTSKQKVQRASLGARACTSEDRREERRGKKANEVIIILASKLIHTTPSILLGSYFYTAGDNY